MVDPEAARAKIIEALTVHAGIMRNAAVELDCTYMTLYRIVASDAELSDRIYKLRTRLMEEGHTQRGWGQWHQGRMIQK